MNICPNSHAPSKRPAHASARIRTLTPTLVRTHPRTYTRMRALTPRPVVLCSRRCTRRHCATTCRRRGRTRVGGAWSNSLPSPDRYPEYQASTAGNMCWWQTTIPFRLCHPLAKPEWLGSTAPCRLRSAEQGGGACRTNKHTAHLPACSCAGGLLCMREWARVWACMRESVRACVRACVRVRLIELRFIKFRLISRAYPSELSVCTRLRARARV